MRQEERRARTRTALLRAAAASFASRGYDSASIDAIAASVGLSKGAVYAHFPSKLDLYAEVASALVEQAERRLERVAEALRKQRPPLESASAYFGLAGDPLHSALMAETWRVAAIEPAIRNIVEAFAGRRLNQLARAGVDSGESPAAALEHAQTVARLIDADMLYRRLDETVAASG